MECGVDMLQNSKIPLKGRLIYFLGPEGVGKTTRAILLHRYLRLHGYRRAKIVNIRWNHLYNYIIFIRLLPRIFSSLYHRYVYPNGVVHLYPRPEFLKKIYSMYLVLQIYALLLVSLIQVFIPLKLGYIVIAEMYLGHTLFDIFRESKGISASNKPTTRLAFTLLQRLIPLQSIIIVLDAPYNVIRERNLTRGTPVRDKLYINLERAFYRVLAKSWSYTCHINTNEDMRISLARILHCLYGTSRWEDCLR